MLNWYFKVIEESNQYLCISFIENISNQLIYVFFNILIVRKILHSLVKSMYKWQQVNITNMFIGLKMFSDDKCSLWSYHTEKWDIIL